MIKALHDRIDRFFKDAVNAAPDQFRCGPGCFECCLVDLSVFEVEAAVIRAAFERLEPGARHAAAARAAAGRHCCMLDPDSGHCIVYDARPCICRSHGLTILIDGQRDCCPLNYHSERPARDNILDVDRLNGALVGVNAADSGSTDGVRVRIADIAATAGIKRLK